jgi:outer membrane protein
MKWFAGSLALVLMASALPVSGQNFGQVPPAPPPLAQAPTPASPPLPPTPPAAPATPPAPTAVANVLGRVLTLPEVIKIALETQPQIQSRLFDYAAARFRVDEAFSPLLPQLSGIWTVSRDRLVFQLGPQITIVDAQTNNSARLALSQILYDFGKTFAATEVSKRLAAVAKEDVEVQRDVIVLAVKQAYFNLLFGQRLIKVNEAALKRADLNLRSARGFYEVGTQPKSAVARAEVDVANAKVSLIQARNAERLARVALNTGMGIPVETPTQIVDVLGERPPYQLDHAKLLGEALSHRPEYKQAKLRVDAAEATVKLQFRSFLPDITGNAFIGRSTLDWHEIWELGLNMNWTIFDGGNRIARYRESLASLKSAEAQVRSQELTIAQDVEQASLNVAEADERIEAAKAAVASADENFRLAQGRFDAGVGTILELTDAQLALTQAQSTEAQALTDFRNAIAALERALGRR